MVGAHALCTACEHTDPHAGPSSAGGAGAGGASATSASSSGATSTSTSGGSGGFGGDDGREWKELEWAGLPCKLLVAGPTVQPTLTWKPCAVSGCSYIDTAPFVSGSKAVGATHQHGNIVTAIVQRAGGFDSVVWDAATGQERFAIRGHAECLPKHFLPSVVDGAERGWFGVIAFDGTDLLHAYYDVDLARLEAEKLDVPGSMSSQRMAGDADHLALETSLGPSVGIWSRDAGAFTLVEEMSFRPRTGAGAVYYLGPDAGGDLDVFWWENGSAVAAVTASSDNFAVNPWVVGGDLVWTEAPGYDQPGVVKRAPLAPSSFPLTGETVVSLPRAGEGQASERFYVVVSIVDGIYRLQIVNLQTKALSFVDLAPEVKWPSTVDFVGKDPFGDKEVAWVQANDTVYRIEIE